MAALLLEDMDLDPLLHYSTIVHDGRPSEVCECLDDDGDIDLDKWMDYQDKERDLQIALYRIVTNGNEDEDETPVKKPPRKRARLFKSRRPFYYDYDGVEQILRPQQTWWYLSYVLHPTLEDDKFKKKFRLRFRMPHPEFVKLVEKVKDSEKFDRWLSFDATGARCSPIELLVLGAIVMSDCTEKWTIYMVPLLLYRYTIYFIYFIQSHEHIA
jgi:hypothetical protein